MHRVLSDRLPLKHEAFACDRIAADDEDISTLQDCRAL
jgi:hypothetical protein